MLTLFICFLTFTSIYGQEVNRNDTASRNILIFNDTIYTKWDSVTIGDTIKMPYSFFSTLRFMIDTLAIDTNKIPYLSAKGIRFSDSLEEVLKNNLTSLLERDEVRNAYVPAFFTSQKQTNFEDQTREKSPFDWVFVALFLYLSTLAFLRLQIPELYSIILHIKKKNLFPRTENLSKVLLYLSLIFASWIGFSLALTEGLHFWGFHFPFEPLLFSSILVFIYFSSKFLLKKISGWMFQMNNVVSEHLSIAINTNFTWVLIAFLVVIINHYVENNYLIWIICVIFCIIFLQKLFLEWIIFSNKLRFFEILLYLCTIEVFPLLLFAKYIMGSFYKI